MTFGLIGWLKSRFPDLQREIPVWYPTRDKTDGREWLVTDGLGGYSMGTVTGAHRRRYHSALVAALTPPHNRHIVLSRIEEVIEIDGVMHELATNHWQSGVISPTGFKLIESFTFLPCPTWVFEIDGNYLVKQLAHPYGAQEVHVGYYWIQDPDKKIKKVDLTLKFLVGFRGFHDQLKGASDKTYSQFVSPNQSLIMLDDKGSRLCLTWNKGRYESQRQWWWDFRWPVEAIRGLPANEDLYLVGQVCAALEPEGAISLAASFDKPIEEPDCGKVVSALIDRQKALIENARMDDTLKSNLLILASDQFIVKANGPENQELSVIEGYPWYNTGGRAAMLGLPGLTLSTRRFDDARNILSHQASRIEKGMMPNRCQDFDWREGSPSSEYESADVTLWWGWALYQYHKVLGRRALEFVIRQLPLMIDAARHYWSGSIDGLSVDPADGLLRCAHEEKEFSWMDAQVEGIPITPRPGKPVELCALWLSFLETIDYLYEQAKNKIDDLESSQEIIAFIEDEKFLTGLEEVKAKAAQAKVSMLKFWCEETQSLYDVLDKGVRATKKKDASLRCNQLLAVSMPFRAFSKDQEKAILKVVESELLTSMGIRTLSPQDSSYQGIFGCGLSHPDQYHRDLSRHQGTAWPFWLGQYCDALLNVYGIQPDIVNRIRFLLQPLFEHLTEEDCLGSISEMFDGNRPHLPRGCPAYSLSVAEMMRWHRWIVKS